MSCLPWKQIALIDTPIESFLLQARAPALLRSRLRRALDDLARAFGAAVGAHDLAGLDDLLQAPQVVRDLLLGRAVQEHREGGARDAPGRVVLHVDAHDRAAAAGF